MRILQLCNKPPYPPRDGGSLAMLGLANSMHMLGHQITVLTMVTSKHKLSAAQYEEFNRMMPVHTVYVETKLTWHSILMNLAGSSYPYTATRFISDEVESLLIKILKSGAYDVIQLEGLYLMPYIRCIRQYSEALISLRAHNVEHEIWERIAVRENNFWKRKYFEIQASRLKLFEYNNMNGYDLLVPITERDREQFKHMGNIRPVHVCPAGIDIPDANHTKLSYSEQSAQNFSLYFLGSLDWLPNQEGLLWFISQVFPTLRSLYPEIKIHVAGRNAPSQFIKKLENPGLVYHGEISDSYEFSRAHTVMVAPCFSGGGMRLKIIEAMALGKTVVTTTTGAEGIPVTQDANIMIADSPVTFSQCIERLIKYPDLCRRIGEKAFQFVNENYNNIKIAGSLAEFYKLYLK